ncbi:MAG: tetratricopeptide repeat protein [Pseudomonadales bacterium]|nr:tetratricopeptide repeat protein [Pseudomonadales bacterium]
MISRRLNQRCVSPVLLLWLGVSVASACAQAAEAPSRLEFLNSFEAADAVMPTQQAQRLSAERSTPLNELESSAMPAGPADNALRSARAITPEAQDLAVVQQALDQIDQGQIIEATLLLTEFVEGQPQAHQSRETLATILLARGETGLAQRVLTRGLELAPNFVGFKKLYARLLMAADAARALALLAEVPPMLEQDPEYYQLYALLLQQTGRVDDATAMYQRLLQIDPTNGRLWLSYAVALDALGLVEDARSAHQTANRYGLGDPTLNQYNLQRLKSLRGNR